MSTVISKPGRYPHIEWLSLRNDGTLVECAIMKKDNQGNRYFIEVGSLDDIDKKRLVRIVTNRNARNFPLWDLMSQTTLNNGVNALNYFHQLVKILTPSGTIHNPRTGEIGHAVVPTQSQQPQQQQEVQQQEVQQQEVQQNQNNTNTQSQSTRKTTTSKSKSTGTKSSK